MSHIFIVTTTPPDAWAKETAETLGALGTVDFATTASVEALDLRGAAVVIIDATAIPAAETFVGHLRQAARQAPLRMVVMTASPTWQRARGAFEAGAMDYLPKEIKGQELVDAIVEILSRRTGPPGDGAPYGTHRDRRQP